MVSFGSVCSGIEAASAAWEPLGWRAAWLAEIDPAASGVLAHHWPRVANLGDLTTLPALMRAGEIEAPDVLIGGTPCQAFSVAGLRGGMADPRGALTMTFVDLANAIDERRAAQGDPPCVILWENVPGVLNHKDNPFGCFLAGLAGEDLPLEPAGRRWTNAGAVLGPQRAIAWRTLDAQFFGLAQRRRRVFVVAGAGDGFDPAEILFEREGVRRDSPPSREKGQGFTHPVAPCLTDSGRGVERTGDPRGQDPVVAVGGLAFGGGNTSGPIDAAACLVAKGQKLDFEVETLMVEQTYAIQERAVSENPNNGPQGKGWQESIGFTLEARHHAQAVCVTGQVTHTLKAEGFDASEDGTGRGQPIIAFHHNAQAAQLPGPDRDTSISDSLTASQQAAAAYPVTVALRGREGGGSIELGGDVATALRTGGGGGDKPHVLAFAQNSRDEVREMPYVGALAAEPGMKQTSYIRSDMAVRRLMPVECERLQGFPDGHTAHGAKPQADGPRYKQLGNSMAVPVIRWIGRRIHQAIIRELLDD